MDDPVAAELGPEQGGARFDVPPEQADFMPREPPQAAAAAPADCTAEGCDRHPRAQSSFISMTCAVGAQGSLCGET